MSSVEDCYQELNYIKEEKGSAFTLSYRYFPSNWAFEFSLLKVIVRKSCHSTSRTRSRRFSRPQVTLYLFLFMRRPLIFPSLTSSFFKNNVFPLFGVNPENLPEETSAEASASVGMDSATTSPV